MLLIQDMPGLLFINKREKPRGYMKKEVLIYPVSCNIYRIYVLQGTTIRRKVHC